MKEAKFTCEVASGGHIIIPSTIMKEMGLRPSNIIKVTIRKGLATLGGSPKLPGSTSGDPEPIGDHDGVIHEEKNIVIKPEGGEDDVFDMKDD